jgi:hypothetical protein
MQPIRRIPKKQPTTPYSKPALPERPALPARPERPALPARPERPALLARPARPPVDNLKLAIPDRPERPLDYYGSHFDGMRPPPPPPHILDTHISMQAMELLDLLNQLPN